MSTIVFIYPTKYKNNIVFLSTAIYEADIWSNKEPGNRTNKEDKKAKKKEKKMRLLLF